MEAASVLEGGWAMEPASVLEGGWAMKAASVLEGVWAMEPASVLEAVKLWRQPQSYKWLSYGSSFSFRWRLGYGIMQLQS